MHSSSVDGVYDANEYAQTTRQELGHETSKGKTEAAQQVSICTKKHYQNYELD